MRREPTASDRVRELLAELDDAGSRAGRSLAPVLARRASRQRTALTVVQLLVAIGRTIPEAVALATRRR